MQHKRWSIFFQRDYVKIRKAVCWSEALFNTTHVCGWQVERKKEKKSSRKVLNN